MPLLFLNLHSEEPTLPLTKYTDPFHVIPSYSRRITATLNRTESKSMRVKNVTEYVEASEVSQPIKIAA